MDYSRDSRLTMAQIGAYTDEHTVAVFLRDTVKYQELLASAKKDGNQELIDIRERQLHITTSVLLNMLTDAWKEATVDEEAWRKDLKAKKVHNPAEEATATEYRTTMAQVLEHVDQERAVALVAEVAEARDRLGGAEEEARDPTLLKPKRMDAIKRSEGLRKRLMRAVADLGNLLADGWELAVEVNAQRELDDDPDSEDE